MFFPFTSHDYDQSSSTHSLKSFVNSYGEYRYEEKNNLLPQSLQPEEFQSTTTLISRKALLAILSLILLSGLGIISMFGGEAYIKTTNDDSSQLEPATKLEYMKAIDPRKALEGEISTAKEEIFPDGKGSWKNSGRADPEAKIRLIFAVKLQNIAYLEEIFYDVSSPSTENYAKYLLKEDLDALTQPEEEVVELVAKYLQSWGLEVTPLTSDGSYLQTLVTVAQAEALLDAEYYLLTHPERDMSVRRCPSYSLPQEIADYIDFVSPTIRVPNLSYLTKTVTEEQLSAGSHPMVTPEILRTMYGVDSYTGTAENNSVAVTAFLEEYFSTDDLEQFWAEYSPDNLGTTVKVKGYNDESDPGSEAELDIQYVTAMAPGVSPEFWSFAGRSPDPSLENEPFLQFMIALNNQTDPPLVVSSSYGEDEMSTSWAYAERINVEFMRAALRGVTLIFASGDSGVGSTWDYECSEHFMPQWPAASPYVTSVGATLSSDPEVTAYFSSGGFSWRWERPEYQMAVVDGYLENTDQMLSSEIYSGKFNTYGRAFPDVAAQGWRFAVVHKGKVEGVYGTSCAAPTFAGVVALVNDARLNAGKGSLGFLNPLIYEYGNQIFSDVQFGHNPGCDTHGFAAVEGWDPASGFGTPNLSKFIEIALSL
mmetsp:Transcript_35007/g.46241  ORF Transcript_35007/g.46241 Transcript_35007/m.46241 type:complete len:650 (-) Transcript_35007:489-2438(-)